MIKRTRTSILSEPLKNNYLILRHGETQANKENIYMGRKDYPLNEAGRAQAGLVELPFTVDIVYYSPLQRAQETMKIITQKHIPRGGTYPATALMEKSGGKDVEGRKYIDLAFNYPDVWDIWGSHSLQSIINSKFPNGESDVDVIKRFEQFISECEKKHTKKNILLVTHSGVIQASRYLQGFSKHKIYLSRINHCQIEKIYL